MRYYIATRLENHSEHNRLRDILDQSGHKCTYDWTVHGAVFRHGLKTVRNVAHLEMDGVMGADLVIVLWPGGRGTHVELGAAIAAGKRIIFVSNIEGHHQATPETCAFYHHSLVTLARTLEEAAFLANETNP